MAFEKKQAFLVVCQNGRYDVSEGPPGDGEEVERTIDAGCLLEAYVVAFGRLPPDLDPGIRDLVVVLNEIPGIATWSSCEGHERAGDPAALLTLSFENLTALEHFSDLVSFVTNDEAYLDVENPPMLGLRLELNLACHFREGQPIPCELLLGRFPMDGLKRGKPPGAKALRAFAAELRKRAAARFPDAVALTAPPIPKAASVPGDEIAQWLSTAPG